MNEDMRSSFKRAEDIRILETEISLNINEVNNWCMLQPEEFRASISTTEPIMRWYEESLISLKKELMKRMDNAYVDYLTLKQQTNERK